MTSHSKLGVSLHIGIAFAALAIVLGAWLSRPFVRLGYVASSIPKPRGAHPVTVHDIAVPLRRPDGRGIVDCTVRLWFPAHGTGPSSMPPPALVIYLPVWGAKRGDNAAFAASLASHGFIVAAIDDIHNDPDTLDATPADAVVRHTLFELSGDEGRARMISRFDRRLHLQAAKVSAILDELIARPNLIPAEARFDPTRIGIAGASFGGAAAVETALRDARLKAVLNFDGWLRGKALADNLTVPFANFNSTRGVPDQAVLTAPNANPNHKFLAARNAETNAFIERHLATRPDTIDVTIAGANHGDFTDEIYLPDRWMQWRPWRRSMIAPARMHEIVDAYAAAFFDTHLGGSPSAILSQNPPPFPEATIRLGRSRAPG